MDSELTPFNKRDIIFKPQSGEEWLLNCLGARGKGRGARGKRIVLLATLHLPLTLNSKLSTLNSQWSRLRLSERRAMLASAFPSVSRLDAQRQCSMVKAASK